MIRLELGQLGRMQKYWKVLNLIFAKVWPVDLSLFAQSVEDLAWLLGIPPLVVTTRVVLCRCNCIFIFFHQSIKIEHFLKTKYFCVIWSISNLHIMERLLTFENLLLAQ